MRVKHPASNNRTQQSHTAMPPLPDHQVARQPDEVAQDVEVTQAVDQILDRLAADWRGLRGACGARGKPRTAQ
jgi:hypothetical protein